MKKQKKKAYRPRGKKWIFTWFHTSKSSFTPSQTNNGKNLKLLTLFYNKFCNENEDFFCQLEKGKKHKKLHIQGRFALLDRLYKIQVLEYFNLIGINSDGLYLDVEKNSEKSKLYVNKSETRVLGPFDNSHFVQYDGKDILYIDTNPTLWQIAAFILLKLKHEARMVNYIYDLIGNSGKTTFVKYCILKTAYLNIKAEYFSLSDVSRVAAGFCNLKTKPDTIFFDLPRSIGKNQSYRDLFIAIEQFKNGFVETNFYGKHLVKAIPTPNVFVVGNIAPSEFLDYIATGRWNIWEVFPIPNDTIYKHKIYTENKIKVHKRDSLVTVKDGKIIYTKLRN